MRGRDREVTESGSTSTHCSIKMDNQQGPTA